MSVRTEHSSSEETTELVSKGLDSLSLGEDGNEEGSDEGSGESSLPDYFQVDSADDFRHIRFDLLSSDEIKQFHFKNLDIAYEFYNEYGRVWGFSIRKHKVGYSRIDQPKEILWKSYVCSKEGLRDENSKCKSKGKTKARLITRCDCNASFRVHVDATSGRWFVSFFEFEHNHELLSKYGGRLRSQSGMSDANLAEMNSMSNVGISIPKIFASFARQSGGFDKVGFGIKDMYNQSDKQRRMQGGDAKAAIRYLRQLASVDPLMFWKHEVDDRGKLRNLFWCDGDSQIDYAVFGELLAFDATYGRNKYKCPIVVFSGVNHHMQTIVFGCAIVADETETTYTWLLEQLLLAMKGKCPKSVITDGDRAIRNAIARVFPEAHHRLCGWHLLRNATTNVRKKKFKEGFRRCMLNDYEVEEFEAKWKEVVAENGVEDVEWVQGIYEKKNMWATAHMRGMFFGGVRTTSRCEGLHSKMGKYIGSRDNLFEFIKHFERCLDYMRNNEQVADYNSCRGDIDLQSCVKVLEKSASKVYTLKVFYLFRDVLEHLGGVKITGIKKTPSCTIYLVNKYAKVKGRSKWHVSYYAADAEFRCSCKGMESLGIPCVHIVCVVVYLDLPDLPNSLILRRWTKNAKEGVDPRVVEGVSTDMGNRITRFGVLQHCCRQLSSVACESLDDFNIVREKVNEIVKELVTKKKNSIGNHHTPGHDLHASVRDPIHVAGPSQHIEKKARKVQRCTQCKEPGHNKRKCPYESSSEQEVEDKEEEGDGRNGDDETQ